LSGLGDCKKPRALQVVGKMQLCFKKQVFKNCGGGAVNHAIPGKMPGIA